MDKEIDLLQQDLKQEKKEKSPDAASADGNCEGKYMNEKEIKFLCKWLVDNGNRPLTDLEKELIKQAIDKADNINDLFAIAVASTRLTEGR